MQTQRTGTTEDRHVRENVKRLLKERAWSVRELSRRIAAAAVALNEEGPSHGRLADLLNDRRGAITWTEIQLLAYALRTNVFAIVLPPTDEPQIRSERAWRWFSMRPDTLSEESLQSNMDNRMLFHQVVQRHPLYLKANTTGSALARVWGEMDDYESRIGYHQARERWAAGCHDAIREIERRITVGEIPPLEELFNDLRYNPPTASRDIAQYNKEWERKVQDRWKETDPDETRGETDVD